MENNQIILNNNLITKHLNSGDYDSCSELLKEAFKLHRSEKNEIIRVPPTTATLNIIGDILNNLTPKIQSDFCKTSLINLIKQCFYSLKISAFCGTGIQTAICGNNSIIENSKIILKITLELNDSVHSDCLKNELQFLSNLVVENKNAQLLIWNKFSDLLIISLNRKDVSYVVVMIFYNIFLENINLIPKQSLCTILTTVLSLFKNNNIENILLLIELLLKKNIFSDLYPELDVQYRIILLEIIYAILVEDSTILTKELISTLCDSFKKKSDCILKTVTDYLKNVEPTEVARLLDCISSASSKENYLKQLQNDKSLFINAAFLLKSIHEAGKNDVNNFSAIQKLSEVRESNEDIQNHPGFGFKAALIRLLGNLCCEHVQNQNMMRELDCIPLLLDCCNIDARNPLIIQWVILAVRNICQNNPENQAVIAETTKVGVVDTAILREMGLTLHDDGANKIGIAPLDLNK